MGPEDNPSDVMQLMMSSGDARSQALAAIAAAQRDDVAAAETAMVNAKSALHDAQLAHNRLLSSEARGEGPQFSILLVHAENHLAGAQTMIEVARAFMVTSAELMTLRKEVADRP